METRQTTTTRATRSQTRSVSADPISRAISRTTRSRSRQIGIEDDVGDLDASKPNARRNARKPATAPLDPVPEDLETDPLEDVIKGAEEALDDETSPGGQAVVTRLESPSVAPPASMDMPSFTQGELESLDSELIIATMEELDMNADRLLKMLVPAEATSEDIQKNLEELYTSDSRLSKLFKKRANILSETQDATFGSGTYIRPDIILRQLFSVESVHELPESHWRPDAIFYEANLANVVSQLCQMTADVRKLEILTSLDGIFPTPFMSETGELETIGSSALVDETFGLALELRTQLAIMYMADQAPQNYEEATRYICSLFIEPPSDAEEPSYDILGIELNPRGWEGLADTREGVSQILVQRVEELRRPFKEGNDPLSALREVEMAFPWYRFQTLLLSWAQMRTQEINNEIAHQGGSPAVIDALKHELNRRSHDAGAVQEDLRKGSLDQLAEEPTVDQEVHEQDQLIDQQPQPSRAVSGIDITSSNATGKKSYTADAMSVLRRARRGLSASIQPVSVGRTPSPSRQTPIDAPEDEYHDIDDVVPDEPMEPESPMKKLLNMTLDRDSRENKENRSRTLPRRTLFDPQEHGERVEFDDGFASQEQSAARSQTNAVQFRQPRIMQTANHETVSPSKRRREPDIEDPSEDEGFEDDIRAPPPKRTRVEYARPSDRVEASVTSPQQSRYQGSSMVGRSHGLTPREKSTIQPQASVSSRPRKNPGQLLDYEAPRLPSADDDDVPAPTPAEQYKLVSHQAKNKRRVKTIVKPPRQRKTWDDQEVNQLVTLIGEHGCSWSLLLQMDHENILADREQGDLKDKARNIKTEYLIAGWELPPNFHLVALDRKAILRCDKYGVIVDQPPQRGRRRVHIVNDEEDGGEDVGEEEIEE